MAQRKWKSFDDLRISLKTNRDFSYRQEELALSLKYQKETQKKTKVYHESMTTIYPLQACAIFFYA